MSQLSNTVVMVSQLVITCFNLFDHVGVRGIHSHLTSENQALLKLRKSYQNHWCSKQWQPKTILMSNRWRGTVYRLVKHFVYFAAKKLISQAIEAEEPVAFLSARNLHEARAASLCSFLLRGRRLLRNVIRKRSVTQITACVVTPRLEQKLC